MTKNRLILLNKLFEAAVAAADPRHCLAANLPTRPKGRTVVLGAGKAAASMARAVEEQWPADVEGLVVTRYGHVVSTDRIEVVQAAHPVQTRPANRRHSASALWRKCSVRMICC